MAPWPTLAFAALALLCRAHAEWLSLPPGWSFSQDLSFPSNSSSSSSLNSYSDIAPFSIFLPIVNTSSFNAGSKGFSLGFLSLFESATSSPSRIYFCTCLGVRKNGPTSRPFLVPVWTLNDTSPLQQQQSHSGFVKLEVDENKQMQLVDGDGTIMWSMSNIGSIEMQDNGNLVLNAPNNQTVWESFKNPSDTLLKNQELRLGMAISSKNHMYKAVMQPGGFLFYHLVSARSLPLVYWLFAANTTVNNYFNTTVSLLSLDASAPINFTSAMNSTSCQSSNDPYASFNGESLELHGACDTHNSLMYGTSDLVRLDDDGNIRDYYLKKLPNSSYTVTSYPEDYRPCHAPNVCGAYGICVVNSSNGNNIQHFCRCPSEKDNTSLSSAFRLRDASNPSQGCERTETLECNLNSTQTMVEIKNVTSIAMLFLFELRWRENRISLDDCKAGCSSNCSCTGFLYHTESLFCLPFGDTTGISNLSLITLSSNDHIAYLKIQPKPAKKHHPIKLVALISLPVVFMASVGVILCRRWKQTRDPAWELAEQQLLGVMPTLPTRFSYQELSRITEGFSARLGSGGFGSVYAGVQPDGMRVAVKKLELLSQGQKEFLAEIGTIGGIRHVNIVQLYGFCLEKQHRLLVYEYMENGSLDKWLFSKEKEQHLQSVLSWETRFNVAMSTARGLAFLHEECPTPILHFDVKPENILLDEDFNAKLADFGLSKLVGNGGSSAGTVVRGTPGYIAPEWVTHYIVSRKCDVYSFGMVLLELVSGRRNVESQLSNEGYFPKWAAKKITEGKVGDLLDKRLVATMNNAEEQGMGVTMDKNILEQVAIVVGVALMCISERPEMRPTMTGVCSMLEGSVGLPKDMQGVDIEAPASIGRISCTSSSSNQVMGSSYSIVEER